MIEGLLAFAVSLQSVTAPTLTQSTTGRRCGEACTIMAVKTLATTSPPMAMKGLSQADIDAVKSIPMQQIYEDYFTCSVTVFSKHPISGEVAIDQIDGIMEDAYAACANQRIAGDKVYSDRLVALNPVWKDAGASKLIIDLNRALGVISLANFYFIGHKNGSFNAYLTSIGV